MFLDMKVELQCYPDLERKPKKQAPCSFTAHVSREALKQTMKLTCLRERISCSFYVWF